MSRFYVDSESVLRNYPQISSREGGVNPLSIHGANSKNQAASLSSALPSSFGRFATIHDQKTLQYVTKRPYIQDTLATPKAAGELNRVGLSNVFNQTWQQLVAHAEQEAVKNSAEGDIAFSKEVGFIKFKNPNLTAEQNRRLAQISLTHGVSIEDTPGRAEVRDEKTSQWVDEFIQNYDTALEKFMTSPSEGMVVKDGRRRYEMTLDPQSGQVLSRYYKKHGGLRGFIERNANSIAAVTDVISKVGAFVPGWGQVASIASSVIGKTAEIIGKGTVKGRDILQGIFDVGKDIFAGKAKIFGDTMIGQALDKGKGILSSVWDGAKDVIGSLIGSKTTDVLLDKGVEIVASGISSGKWEAKKIADALLEAFPELVPEGNSDVAVLAREGVKIAAASIDSGKINLEDVADVLAKVYPEYFEVDKKESVFQNVLNGAKQLDAGCVCPKEASGVVAKQLPILAPSLMQSELSNIDQALFSVADAIASGRVKAEDIVNYVGKKN